MFQIYGSDFQTTTAMIWKLPPISNTPTQHPPSQYYPVIRRSISSRMFQDALSLCRKHMVKNLSFHACFHFCCCCWNCQSLNFPLKNILSFFILGFVYLQVSLTLASPIHNSSARMKSTWFKSASFSPGEQKQCRIKANSIKDIIKEKGEKVFKKSIMLTIIRIILCTMHWILCSH